MQHQMSAAFCGVFPPPDLRFKPEQCHLVVDPSQLEALHSVSDKTVNRLVRRSPEIPEEAINVFEPDLYEASENSPDIEKHIQPFTLPSANVQNSSVCHSQHRALSALCAENLHLTSWKQSSCPWETDRKAFETLNNSQGVVGSVDDESLLLKSASVTRKDLENSGNHSRMTRKDVPDRQSEVAQNIFSEAMQHDGPLNFSKEADVPNFSDSASKTINQEVTYSPTLGVAWYGKITLAERAAHSYQYIRLLGISIVDWSVRVTRWLISGNADHLRPEEPAVPSRSGKLLMPHDKSYFSVSTQVREANRHVFPVQRPLGGHEYDFAAYDSGARIIDYAPGVQNVKAVQRADRESYLLAPCAAPIWFVLSFPAQLFLRDIVLISTEFFSSAVREVQLFGANRFPGSDWRLIATLNSRVDLAVQRFSLENVCSVRSDSRCWVRYLYVKVVDVYLVENFRYCTLNQFRVFGSNVFDSLDNVSEGEKSEYDEFEMLQKGGEHLHGNRSNEGENPGQDVPLPVTDDRPIFPLITTTSISEAQLRARLGSPQKQQLLLPISLPVSSAPLSYKNATTAANLNPLCLSYDNRQWAARFHYTAFRMLFGEDWVMDAFVDFTVNNNYPSEVGREIAKPFYQSHSDSAPASKSLSGPALLRLAERVSALEQHNLMLANTTGDLRAGYALLLQDLERMSNVAQKLDSVSTASRTRQNCFKQELSQLEMALQNNGKFIYSRFCVPDIYLSLEEAAYCAQLRDRLGIAPPVLGAFRFASVSLKSFARGVIAYLVHTFRHSCWVAGQLLLLTLHSSIYYTKVWISSVLHLALLRSRNDILTPATDNPRPAFVQILFAPFTDSLKIVCSAFVRINESAVMR